MRFKTPRGWYQRARPKAPLAAPFLRAASLIWALATARRIGRGRPIGVGVPVICVGNLTLGGSGKTPVVRELARRLASGGLSVRILTRGHGGRVTGPLKVDPTRHTAADVGDEALMMGSEAVVWIARDRAAGARAAAEDGAAAIVMDDGHQNPDVCQALSIIVVDGETRNGEWPFGDGGVFPAGPMREPLGRGLARADAVVVLLPADLSAPDEELLSLFAGKPVFVARLAPTQKPPLGPQIGFAGLGKPWKMERALKAAGCELIDFVSLADHAPLDDAWLRGLARRALARGAGLVTSEKDWMRLAPTWRAKVSCWPVRASFEDEAALDALIGAVLSRG